MVFIIRCGEPLKGFVSSGIVNQSIISIISLIFSKKSRKRVKTSYPKGSSLSAQLLFKPIISVQPLDFQVY